MSRKGRRGKNARHQFKLLGSRCFFCKQKLGFYNEKTTIDHLIPSSKGGSNKYRNKVFACEACNRIKGDMVPLYITQKARRKEIQLIKSIGGV